MKRILYLELFVFQIIIVLALSWCVKSADKDDDESRPYEFGFTIDGQQHRRESKDVNGIIMGEFGFITGDGVYHVTVYATDENGAFKIISMKNIKISEPLDTPGYQFGKSPTAVGGAVIATTTTTTTTTTTPKNNAPYDFTTVPSLNVAACSSCKIPSTTPRPSGAPNKLVFQTPAFQNKRPAEDRPNSFDTNRPPVNNLTPPFRSPDIPNNPKAPFDNSRNPTPPLDNSRNPIPPLDNSRNPIPPFDNSRNPIPPLDNARNPIPPLDNSRNPIPPFDNSRNPIPPFDNSRNPIPPFNNPTNPRPIPQPSPDQQTPYSNPETGVIQINNPKEQNRSDPQPAKYQIEDNEIKIPGRQSIPIKDPYPNMVNGLPDGITETDISDLLYKFNYTLGFHGHYEKGLKNGAKVGGYFVNGRDGISRVVTYVADENGYRPKVKFINLGLESENTPKEGTEKKFGLKGFEFVWYPL